MSRNKYLMAGVVLLVIVLLVGASVAFANIKYAQEGTVKVVTKWGASSASTSPRTAGSRRSRRAGSLTR